MFIDGGAEIFALSETLFINALREIEIAYFKASICRIRTETERAVSRAEIARTRKRVRHGRNADVRRQVVPRAEFVRHNAAKARVVNRRAGTIAREHVVRAAIVIGFAMG